MKEIELVINIAVNNPLCPLSQKEMVLKVAHGKPLHKIYENIEILDKVIDVIKNRCN